MSLLSEHEGSGAIGMLRAGMRVTMLRDIIIAIHQLYSASKIVTRLLGQLKTIIGLVNHE